MKFGTSLHPGRYIRWPYPIPIQNQKWGYYTVEMTPTTMDREKLNHLLYNGKNVVTLLTVKMKNGKWKDFANTNCCTMEKWTLMVLSTAEIARFNDICTMQKISLQISAMTNKPVSFYVPVC